MGNTITLDSNIIITNLIHSQALRNPRHTALKDSKFSLSFSDLDNETDIIAKNIINKIPRTCRIGILLPHGIYQIIAMVGVMKSGCSYVPIDYDTPNERITLIFKDCDVDFIITDYNKSSYLLEFKALTIDELKIENLLSIQLPHIKLDDEACVLYTSGSTGIPKGIRYSHGMMALSASFCRDRFETIAKLSTILTTNVIFAASILPLFGVLTSGGLVIVPNKDTCKDARMIREMLIKYRVSFYMSVWSVFSLMPHEPLPDLELLVLTGERVIVDCANYWRSQTRLINGYGITEAGGFVSYREFNSNGPFLSSSIGKELPWFTIYLLDENHTPVKNGEIGHLVFGGWAISKGYVNESSASNNFFKNPFLTEDDENLDEQVFDTGDLAIRKEDGTLMFLGRADQQIKINGHRIEIGEVESALRKLNKVTEVAAKAVDISGVKRLVAYVKMENPEGFDSSMAREEMSKTLLDYMVPSAIIALKEFPRTTSGKIDRKNLPIPTLSHEVDVEDTPQTETEKDLAELWKELLGVNNIGRKDSFTRLGGESIMMVHLSFRIEDKFGVRIKVSELFGCKDLSAMALLIDERSPIKTEGFITKDIPTDQPLPASILSLWTECSKSEKISVRYNLPFIYELPNDISTIDFNKSLGLLIDSCDALRATIVTNDKAMTIFHFSSTFIYEAEEINIEKNNLEDYIDKKSYEPFDFSKELFKCFLLRVSDGRSLCLFIVHHLVADGWSWGLISKSIHQALNGEKPTYLGSFAEYIYYANNISSEKTKEAECFWNNYVKESNTLDIKHKKTQSHTEGSLIQVPFPTNMTEKVSQYCSTKGITVFSFYYSVFALLMYRLYGRKDFLTMFVSSGRDEARWQNVVGYLVHPLLLRFKKEYVDLSFSEYVLQISSDLQLVQEHLTDMLSLASICRNNGIDNIADISFNMTLPGEETRKNDTSMFALSFEVAIHRERPQINVEYQKDAFSEEEIKTLTECCFAVIDKIMDSCDSALKSIDVVSRNYKETIIAANDLSARKLATPVPFIDAFEKYSKSGETAIIEDGRELTYKELYENVSSIALELQANGLKEFSRVAVSLPRSSQFIATTLAIWKCNCSYVPIDPGMPQSRVDFIVKDAGCAMLIDKRNIYTSVDDISEDEGEAYVIYTSGTTGTPKGVPISHLAMTHQLMDMVSIQHIDESTRMLQFANVSFDPSVVEIFATLSMGGSVFIADEQTRHDPHLLWQYLEKNSITNADIPPALLSLMPQKALPSLKLLLVGGESARHDVLDYWRQNRTLYNAYGPTENTVNTTLCLIDQGFETDDIGSPMPAVACYVLNNNLNLVPDGFEGELYIGGLQLTEGYINRPELNAKVFVNNPYVSEEDKKAGINLRLYKSGDRVIRRSNGHFIFRGRIDHQVKLRGFRIELGEIETALMQIENVSSAVCKVIGEDLIAYIQTENASLTIDYLRNTISTRLPQYMIPTKWAIVDRFPLTINGKIDFSRMTATSMTTSEDNEEILSLKEKILVDVASSIVGVKIGVNDDLFLSGMTSLQVIRFIGKSEASSIHITVSQVYEKRNIRNILSDATVNESFWYNELDTSKPVLVLISGYVYYTPFHSVLLETFKNEYSIYIIDSYTEYFYGRKEDEVNVNDLVKHYVNIIENLPLNGRQLILTGYCLGAELALRVASEMSTRPLVINMEGFYTRNLPHNDANYPSGIVGWKFRITDKITSQFTPIIYDGPSVHFFCTQPTSIVAPELDEQPEMDMVEIKESMETNVKEWQQNYPSSPLYRIDCDHYNMMQHPYIDEVFEKIKETIENINDNKSY